MADFPTQPDLFRVGRDEILKQNSLLSAAVVARDGSDANLLVAAGAAMGDRCIGQLIVVTSGLYLDSAEKQALDRLLFDRYGLTRKPAAPALVNVAFTLASPAAAGFSIPVGTILSSSTGSQFVTTTATAIAAGGVGPVYVVARSILAGSAQQVVPGAVNSIVSSVNGAPSGLAVTNQYASAGAADREQDDAFRARGRAFWTTAQRGTLAAIQTGALATPGVVRANAIEVVDGASRPGRWVLLVVADQFTDALVQANQGVPPSYLAQSQALGTQVFNTLDEYRCFGIYVQVVVAQVVMVSIGLNLTFAAGVDPLATANAAQAVVVGYVNGLAPGEIFDPAVASAQLRQVAGLVITGNEIAVPAGRIVPAALQVLRTTAQLVTGSSLGLPIAQSVNPDTLTVSFPPSVVPTTIPN
jgi:hypothetical protein